MTKTYNKKITRDNLYIPKNFTHRTYSRYIRQFIDEHNYGYLHPTKGNKTFRYSTTYINHCWASHSARTITSIKLKFNQHLIPHLENRQTYLYTQNRNSRISMFVIDLDNTATSDYEDILQVAEYIKERFHNDIYYEISTQGQGIHIYLFVNWLKYDNTLTTQNINYLFNDYSTYLAKTIQYQGYNCRVDKIKGSYPYYVFDNKLKCFQIVKRGTLCKLPRPTTETTFQSLIHSPIFSLAHIKKNIQAIKELLPDNFTLSSPVVNIKKASSSVSVPDSVSKSSSSIPPENNLPLSVVGDIIGSLPDTAPTPNSTPDISFTDLFDTTPSTPTTPDIFYSLPPSSLLSSLPVTLLSTTFGTTPIIEPETQIINRPELRGNKCIEKMKSEDAMERTFYSIMFLAQKLGRLPDYKEWNKLYLTLGNITNIDEDDRRKRFEDRVKYIAQTFEPDKFSRLYTVGEYEEGIKNKITKEEMDNICKSMNIKHRITHTHLCVGIGYHYMCNITNQRKGWELTVPVRGMICLFRVLKSIGLIKKSCNYNQVRAIREALLKIGYITLLNNEYWYEPYKEWSKAKQWGLGEMCPRYDEYIDIVGMDTIQAVLKSRKGLKLRNFTKTK